MPLSSFAFRFCSCFPLSPSSFPPPFFQHSILSFFALFPVSVLVFSCSSLSFSSSPKRCLSSLTLQRESQGRRESGNRETNTQHFPSPHHRPCSLRSPFLLFLGAPGKGELQHIFCVLLVPPPSASVRYTTLRSCIFDRHLQTKRGKGAQALSLPYHTSLFPTCPFCFDSRPSRVAVIARSPAAFILRQKMERRRSS